MTDRILKHIKVLAVVSAFFGCNTLLAQEVKVNDEIYKVKNDIITKAGVEVTETLSEEQKNKIFAIAKDKRLQETANLEKIERLKEAEKREKRIDKKRKKTQKAFKKNEKLQSNFKSADKKYNKTVSKYNKLKEKGKLSPEDESKMLLKIDKLKVKLEKAKRKLK